MNHSNTEDSEKSDEYEGFKKYESSRFTETI